MKRLNLQPDGRLHRRTSLAKHRWYRYLTLFLLLFLYGFTLIGQTCDLECRGTQDMPLEIEVSTSCMLNIQATDVLDVPTDCPGVKSMVIRDDMNAIIAQGLDSLTFFATDHLDTPLSVTVTDTTTGLFCVGFIRLVDRISPSLIHCEDYTIDCSTDPAPGFGTTPDISDNCLTGLSLEFEDEIIPFDCPSDTLYTIRRTWTAEDAAGMTGTCEQLITVVRPEMTAIVFPDTIRLDCVNPDATPASTGVPTFNGEPIDNGGVCELSTVMRDDTTFLCGDYSYAIARTWEVQDMCSGTVMTDVQTILIEDTLAPTITCPDDLLFETETSGCHTTVTLPTPVFNDNCDVNPDLFVSTSYGAVGLGPHPFVPVGTHTVQYTIADACGNTSICTMTITVVDSEEPTAICEDFLIVSVPSGGIAAITASTFADGSTDNCADQLYFKARRMTTGECNGINGDDADDIVGYQEWFDDRVFFCCDEAGIDSIRVMMRVYEIDPGDGPIDPTREQIGGDLYGHFTECMLMVEVQDKLPPVFVHCPDDLIISCTDDYSDLSIFGTAMATDNCGFTMDSTELVAINECGTGSIIRTFTATDAQGNTSTCVQNIEVINDRPLDESMIEWPQNFNSSVCGINIDPDDLPAGFDRPVLSGNACGILSYNHEDAFFDIAFPACYKILRTWTVLDWCEYDPDNPADGGRFTHTQVIKITDSVSPVLTCLEDQVFGVSSNCLDATISLPPITAADCSNDVLITNNSPYAVAGGADASGTYPLGTTVVRFEASDRCGNTASCEVRITVEDQSKPNPLCIVGLSASLYEQDGEIMAMVDAVAFDGGSADNCTDGADLHYTVRRGGGTDMTVPTATKLMFTCADIGTQLVEFWATDAAGNSDYCLTYIAIQDNMALCPTNVTTNTGFVAGGITTEDGEFVENVQVQISGGSLAEVTTGDSGFFEFPNIPQGEDYTIIPHRTDDPLNGVTTFDLVLITQHILGMQMLDSPYKIIAADVDKSGSVSTLDIIRLRQVILNLVDELPNGNKSWRFVDAGFTFPDPVNPFTTYFPEIYNINDMYGDMMEADFVAIKVGDVNGSALPNTAIGQSQRTHYGEVMLEMKNQEFTSGETVLAPIDIQDVADVRGFQFTLLYDPTVLEFVQLQTGDLPGLTEENVGLRFVAEGMITMSWHAGADAALEKKQNLLQLEFLALTNGHLGEELYIGSHKTSAEAYARSGDVRGVGLHFQTPAGVTATAANFELYQNRPNPFDHSTIIPFNLPMAGEASLRVYDMAGKVIYHTVNTYESGYHELTVSRDLLPATGLFYYELSAGTFKDTKKMILID